MNSAGQVVITGAAGGMGLATCQYLAQQGYQVLAIDHNHQRLQAVQQLSPRIQTLAIELSDETLSEAVRQTLIPSLPVVGVVNMAGISKGNTIDKLTDADWETSFAVNVTPAMRLIRLLTPDMQRNQRGSIVNVGSPVGIIGARKPSYAASKAALHGLTMSCARQLGADNIRVNLLLPGPTITYMTCDWEQQRRDSIAEGTFLKRLCTPEEIAKVIAFLIGNDSSYITGAVIDMTAGSLYGH